MSCRVFIINKTPPLQTARKILLYGDLGAQLRQKEIIHTHTHTHTPHTNHTPTPAWKKKKKKKKKQGSWCSLGALCLQLKHIHMHTCTYTHTYIHKPTPTKKKKKKKHTLLQGHVAVWVSYACSRAPLVWMSLTQFCFDICFLSEP